MRTGLSCCAFKLHIIQLGKLGAVGASRCISLRGDPLIISTRPTIVTGKSIISTTWWVTAKRQLKGLCCELITA